MEWTVVTVIIALVGFVAALVKPITSLTKSITTLTVVVDQLKSDMDEQREHSRTSHQKLWDHNAEQDNKIQNHEQRIHDLEQK